MQKIVPLSAACYDELEAALSADLRFRDRAFVDGLLFWLPGSKEIVLVRQPCDN